MQILKGTKREITITLWIEELEKQMNRANNSMECFKRFQESGDIENLIADCEKIIETANNAKQAIEFMNDKNIK